MTDKAESRPVSNLKDCLSVLDLLRSLVWRPINSFTVHANDEILRFGSLRSE